MKKVIMIIMAVALMALPTMAQQQEDQWKSTSTMRTSGSAYTPQVTAVGATSVAYTATTTESYSPAKAPGPRKNNYNDLFDTGADTGQSSESPIGDAVLPLMLMGLAYAGYIAMKRAKA